MVGHGGIANMGLRVDRSATWPISVFARAGANICTIAMLALPIVATGYWMLADSTTLLGRYAELPGIEAISFFQRAAGLVITLLTLGVIVFILWVLRGLLWEISRGHVLSRLSAKAIQRLSIGTAAYATTIIVTHAAMSSILTLNAGEGQRIVQLTVSSETVILYGVSAILLILSVVVGQAAEVQEDNAMIV